MKQKIIGAIVILVIGVAIGASLLSGSSPSTKKAGGGDIVNQYPTINSAGLQFNGLTSNPIFMNFQPMTIGSGQNQVSWQNLTGHTIFVSNLRAIYTNAVASGVSSSTLFLSVGTSTGATVTDATKNAVYGSLIDTFSISSSTNITASSSLVRSSEKDAGTNGQYVIAVQPTQYVIATLESPCPLATSASGGACELATSTNRGYNLDLFFKYQYYR